MKQILLILLVIGIALLAWRMFGSSDTLDEVIEVPLSSEEAAQSTTGSADIALATVLVFMEDVALVAPPEVNDAAADRLYAALSEEAQMTVDREMLARDIALFVGIQDVPDEGVRVEEVVVDGENATVSLELRYSGAPAYRIVYVVWEEGAWRIARVEPYEPDVREDEILDAEEKGEEGGIDE